MITLIGHGYIGSAIAAELTRQDVIFSWQHHTEVRPIGTAIINAAGFTGTPNVDECEARKADTIVGNITFPMKVEAMACGLPVVHITSGCVYDGYTPGGWTEEDKPNFDFSNGSFYSGTKALAQTLLDTRKNYLLRIRLPFGSEEHRKNYLTKLQRYARLIDVRNSISCIDDIARAAVFFARAKPEPGIYNVCNSGDVTTGEVAELLGLEKPWVTREEFALMVKAPRSNCTLSVEKLARLMPVRDVHEALRECIPMVTA
jgi:3,5-epimerase/4-reductase